MNLPDTTAINKLTDQKQESSVLITKEQLRVVLMAISYNSYLDGQICVANSMTIAMKAIEEKIQCKDDYESILAVVLGITSTLQKSKKQDIDKILS